MRATSTRFAGLVLTDHELDVPLDHGRPNGPALRLFAREVVSVQRTNDALPWLLFLQGGPGFSSPRPAEANGWIGRAVRDYRVLLLDQRGTGRSSPVSARTLARVGGARKQADYLRSFRADSIVRDAELVRARLVGADEPWSVLGQSFGGFCLAHYLSVAPHGVREALFTGGLPPIDATADDVYRRTYRHVLAKNERWLRRHPGDEERANEVAEHLHARDVRLPCGDRLTPRRFQQLGILLGAHDGAEQLHWLLDETFVDGPEGRELSYVFLRRVENALAYDTHPIYSLLHEACYAQGCATRWSAHRVRAEHEAFEWTPGRPLRFTGEMIYPWMFAEYGALAPLRETAELLAEREDWPRLYERDALAACAVPCAAAIWADDTTSTARTPRRPRPCCPTRGSG